MRNPISAVSQETIDKPCIRAINHFIDLAQVSGKSFINYKEHCQSYGDFMFLFDEINKSRGGKFVRIDTRGGVEILYHPSAS